MANIYNEPGSTAVKITLKNNDYSYLNTNIGIAKICLITDQKKFGYSDLNGNLKKCLTDASGSSLTPKNCVFIADSEGSASHSTTFVYNDNKLGVNIATPKNKAHFHEPSTGNCLIQITNASRGSSDDNDGVTIGIVGDDNVIRTTYGYPVKIQAEDPDNPGTFVDLATFQNIDSNSKNTILNTDLTVNIIPDKSTAASVFLTHENNTIKTRTAAQVLDDIGAAAVNHTLVSHSDWSTYFNQALKTTSSPTFASINIGGMINDWTILGPTNDGFERLWYKAYELTGTGRADEDIELRIEGDVNYYYGACIVRLKITRFENEPANQLHVTITPISGWPSNALVKVDGGIVWVASNLRWGDIYGRLVQTRVNPGRVLFNTAYTQTEPAGVSINGTFGVKTYDGDTQNVVLHNVDGANGNFTGQVNTNTALIGKTTATPGGGYKLEVEGNTLVNGKTSTNKLNTGTFVRKTLTTSYTIIDLNNESSWNFRIKTSLSSAPVLYFNNAKEGDEIFIVNEYGGSNPIEVLSTYTSGTGTANLSPGLCFMLRCIGHDINNHPVYAVIPQIWLGIAELKP